MKWKSSHIVIAIGIVATILIVALATIRWTAKENDLFGQAVDIADDIYAQQVKIIDITGDWSYARAVDLSRNDCGTCGGCGYAGKECDSGYVCVYGGSCGEGGSYCSCKEVVE